jgi:hypothetical protein
MDASQPTAEGLGFPGFVRSYNPDGDLSTYEYCFVELDTTRNRAVKAFAGGNTVGVLINKPVETATSTAFSTIAQVQIRGVALVKAGAGGLAVGDLVKAGTGGVGDKATPTDGDMIEGVVEIGATAGLPAAVRLEKWQARVLE